MGDKTNVTVTPPDTIASVATTETVAHPHEARSSNVDTSVANDRLKAVEVEASKL